MEAPGTVSGAGRVSRPGGADSSVGATESCEGTVLRGASLGMTPGGEAFIQRGHTPPMVERRDTRIPRRRAKPERGRAGGGKILRRLC